MDVEEQVGSRIAAGRGGFGGGGLPIPMGKMGGGGIGTILIVLLFLFISSRGGGGLGVDPGTGQFPPAPGASATDLDKAPADDPAKFIDFVAGDVDATWQKIFADSGKTYEQPVIVLYDDGVQSACGNTPSTVGPFYCPPDRKVYLDLIVHAASCSSSSTRPATSRRPTSSRTRSGTTSRTCSVSWRTSAARSRRTRTTRTSCSVRVELQADCLAGVWAHSAYAKGDLLESGDLDEGLNAAAAVGDDRIQKQAGRGVDPDSFTHGSSEQRVKWFRAGFDTGDPTACDTFKGDV